MYLKHLYCENQGPISKINLEMKFKDNLPVPYIIVGQNGSGKSILLSNIVDAFYEIGALKYHNVKPLDEFGRAAYFKIISKLYPFVKTNLKEKKRILPKKISAPKTLIL